LNAPTVDIEIVYAEPQRAIIKAYRVAAGASIGDALLMAEADPVFRAVDFAGCRCGVFGKLATNEQLLSDNDRIEIYRPLAADPKIARRARARQTRR
jgi:putative ubiquitin-RnfH superfamily antitoxin RatB of RatAB toxin-antitoxin module